MSKRASIFVGCVCAVIAVVVVLVAHSLSLNPLRQSEPSLRSWILNKAPLGSSPKAVVALISNRDWTKSYEWTGKANDLSEKFYPGVKGVHIIGADLGYYNSLPWGRVDIDAYWGFDADDKLVDFRVRKMVGAL